jgi:TolB-like protein/DNA-binding winged helix-turn-helix (wHTH) protein/tetratricopeptide (TPR) repeat protein
MTDAATLNRVFQFGEFTLDESRAALLRDGEEVHLRRQSFDVLRFLAAHPGRLVTKTELFAAVWPGTVVTDDSLTQCLVEIRRAIGDGGREIIRTVPRRGFVFELPVVELAGPEPAPAVTVATSGQRRWMPWLAVAGLGAALALALGWVLTDGGPSSPEPSRRAPANTIAVLAFSDLSEGGDQQYFADGVAEEILNFLTRIPDLKVVARTSSFAFRASDADVVSIGKTLDVAYVLEGSVRRVNERVRVTAQLVDAASGTHVWSENYDSESGDMIAVQAGIAKRVAQSLHVTLTGDALASARRTTDPAAYEHYLRGRYLHNRRQPGDLELAVQSFQRALDVDPDYGPALAGLAGALMLTAFDGSASFASVQPAVEEAVLKALEVEPDSPEVQLRATQYFAHAGDRERANRHREQARALGRNSALVLASEAGNLVARGEFSEAAALNRRAVSLDPLNPIVRWNLASCLAANGEYEEAYRQFKRARELGPRDSQQYDRGEAGFLVLLGRHDVARELAQRMPEGPDRDYTIALAWNGPENAEEFRAAIERLESTADAQRGLRLAEIHATVGDADTAFAWIEVAREEIEAVAPTPGSRGRALSDIIPSPLLRPLHDDPRWAALILEVESSRASRRS